MMRQHQSDDRRHLHPDVVGRIPAAQFPQAVGQDKIAKLASRRSECDERPDGRDAPTVATRAVCGLRRALQPS
jgi:hypothetical protein